jgi:hypothetical protein
MKISRKVHSNKRRHASTVYVTNKNRCACNSDTVEMVNTGMLMRVAIYKKATNQCVLMHMKPTVY